MWINIRTTYQCGLSSTEHSFVEPLKMKFVISFLIALCHLNGQCSAGDWSYDDETGPDQWPNMYPQCGGIKQTPIDIDTWGVTCSEYQSVQFLNYKTALTNPKILNNGHTVQVSGKSPSQVVTSFGGESETYNFAQFHTHWGSDNSQGSEHTIDGRQFPMEMHYVHTNVKYPNDYINRTNGIAVVGIFFKISKQDNPALKPLIDSLPKIVNPNSEASLPSNSIKLISFLPQSLKMYTYQGSLTTPTCNEAVRWLVLPTPIPISDNQMKAFRTLKDSHGQTMVDNWRPVQDLNDRAVCAARGIVIDMSSESSSASQGSSVGSSSSQGSSGGSSSPGRSLLPLDMGSLVQLKLGLGK